MSTAFITGCATGFGQRLARRLLALGWHVVATDPDPAAVREALDASDTLRVFSLDAGDPATVTAAVESALAWRPIDVLVNNGGYAIFGTQEEADIDAVRDMFEVNVLGLGRVTQALLPCIRERHGVVVNVSSIAGRLVFPESGWYAATKHAVEAMSMALSQEVAADGVRVRLIEPGSFDTHFAERAAHKSKPRDMAGPYASRFAQWDADKATALEAPQDPEMVVDAILASLQTPFPFQRVLVGTDAQRLLGDRKAPDPDAWSRDA